MTTSVATERKSFLPLRLRSTTTLGSTSTPTVSRSATPVPTSMLLPSQHETKSSLIVGNRVLVNGLKTGILRYIGSVQFARGVFYGVELDEPDGKHDGQVNDTRYFQCKTNHGVFVPHDKVALAARVRANTIQRPIARLKPPIMTRSLTISSSATHKIEQVPIKPPSTTVHLPDIIPSHPAPTLSTPKITTMLDPVITDIHVTITPAEPIKPILKLPPVTIEESVEITDVDFTDSVSLILHQLQQDPQPFNRRRCHSMAISEEGTIDDDDELDTESIAESMISEKYPSMDPLPSANETIKSNQTSNTNKKTTMTKNNLSSSKLLSYSNKSLASSTTSIHKLQITPVETKKKANLLTPVIKKVPERKLSVPQTTTPSIPRTPSIAPSKKGFVSSTKPDPVLGSQSKLSQSLSSSTSVNSSRSDLTVNPGKISKPSPKATPNTTRGIIRSLDFNTKKKPEPTRELLDSQLMIHKTLIQSLELTNAQLKKQYQHLLNQFDLLCLLNQHHMDHDEQIKQEYQCKLSKVRGINQRLKTSVGQLQTSHKRTLITLNEQHQNQLYSMKENHKQESLKHQQEMDKLAGEKIELQSRCAVLQDQVDRFMEEMANSEYADPLLSHVETLEKDRTSLQTVLELRNQELTQLRTRINEQVFQREDQLVLQRRIDMVENRNQDLVCLLRNWQLNEKAVAVERDQLKEQLALLERDNQQLTFERETLLYSLRQRSTTISYMPTSNPRPMETRPNQARSLSCLIMTATENERFKRSVSVDCIL